MTANQLSWQALLKKEQQEVYFKTIESFLVNEESMGKTIYPSRTNWFKALELTPFKQVRVVILGQDPYHGPNQAHGLAFSVKPNVKPPPSLRNIYQELNHDLGLPIAQHGYLDKWAKQGVLLLNTCLTVEAGKPQSHSKIGWQHFTDQIIQYLNEHPFPIVYLLWGSSAQKKQNLIDNKKHFVLTAPHPSPLSAYRGFIGCGHFSKTNELLTQAGRGAIDWAL